MASFIFWVKPSLKLNYPLSSLIYPETLKQMCQSNDVLRELCFLRCFCELTLLTIKTITQFRISIILELLDQLPIVDVFSQTGSL